MLFLLLNIYKHQVKIHTPQTMHSMLKFLVGIHSVYKPTCTNWLWINVIIPLTNGKQKNNNKNQHSFAIKIQYHLNVIIFFYI
jgi:hypothetical protein